MPKPKPIKKALISVQLRWWEQAATQTEQLASDAARVAKLIPAIQPDQISKEILAVLTSLLTRFSDVADALTEELVAIEDGASTYLIHEGGDPGPSPVDLAAVAKDYLAGHVVGDDVLVERVWDYGDGPDALPDAIESVAKRMRQVAPELRTAAQVFVLLSKDADPAGTAPAAG